MKQFPAYQSAEIAARWGCFHCCTPLDVGTLQDDGHAEGRYSMDCAACRMRTWFDIEEPQQ